LAVHWRDGTAIAGDTVQDWHTSAPHSECLRSVPREGACSVRSLRETQGPVSEELARLPLAGRTEAEWREG